MAQEDNKQFFALLDISRPNFDDLPPQSYAIKLFNIVTGTTRLIEHTFQINHHYVFQLWPCAPQHQQQINIQIAAIHKQQHSVSQIASADPLVTYCHSGQTYKFYSPSNSKASGKFQKEQIVFEFKIVERKTFETNLETEQLKKMNKEITSYLQTCKHQLQNYQHFLSFTNDVLRQLNQSDPIPQIPQFDHREPNTEITYGFYQATGSKGKPIEIQQDRSIKSKKNTERSHGQTAEQQLYEKARQKNRKESSEVQTLQKQLTSELGRVQNPISFIPQERESKQQEYQQGIEANRSVYSRRRAKTTKSNELSPYSKSHKLEKQSQPQQKSTQLQVQAHQPSASKQQSSRSKESKASQSQNQYKKSKKEPLNILSKHPYLSYSKPQSHHIKRSQEETIPEREESEDQDNNNLSSSVQQKIVQLEKTLLTNKSKTSKTNLEDKVQDSRQQLALTIKKRREEYRRYTTQPQQRQSQAEQSLRSSNQAQSKVRTESHIQVPSKVPTESREPFKQPISKKLTSQRVLQINQYLKPQPLKDTHQKESTPQTDLGNSFDTQFLPELQINPSFVISNKQNHSLEAVRRKKKRIGTNSREASVIGSDDDDIISPKYQKNPSKYPNQRENSRKAWCYDICLWDLKATIYNASIAQQKRCHLSIQSKNYQTDISLSHQNHTYWNNKITMKTVNETSVLSVTLFSADLSSPKFGLEADSKIAVLDLNNNRSSYFRSYLYHNQLAIGFLEFKYELNRIDNRKGTSLPQITNNRQKPKETHETGLPPLKKSVPDLNGSNEVGHDGYQSRIRQAKQYFFPRMK